MEIELLYFDGCPSWKKGLENLKKALYTEGLKAGIRLVKVADPAEAERLRFPGSPSFRLDNVDLWYEKRERYDLSCRVYATPEGMKGAPTVEMLREQLRLHK